MKTPLVVVGSLCGLFGSLSAQTTVTNLLSDDFSSAVVNAGSATVAAGVSSATQWYQTAANSTTVANGGLSLFGNVGTAATNGRMALAYFTPTGNLTVGSTLTLSYDFSVTGIGDGGGNALRVGLFDSANSRPTIGTTGLIGLGSATAGSSDTANAPYNAWQGYLLGFNHKATSANDTTNRSGFLKRTVNSASGLEQSLTSPTFYTSLAQPSPFAQGFSFVDGTTYSASISISRVSDTELDLTYTVAGHPANSFTQTQTISASDVIQFDALNFYIKQGTTASTKMVSSWNIDNVVVELATPTAVPEPATWSLISCSAVLLGAIWWRRQGRSPVLQA